MKVTQGLSSEAFHQKLFIKSTSENFILIETLCWYKLRHITILSSGNDKFEMSKKLNSCLSTLSEWFDRRTIKVDQCIVHTMDARNCKLQQPNIIQTSTGNPYCSVVQSSNYQSDILDSRTKSVSGSTIGLIDIETLKAAYKAILCCTDIIIRIEGRPDQSDPDECTNKVSAGQHERTN